MATASATRIGPADHGRAMTLEEFREAIEEEGYRYELADGILEVGDVPDDDHGMVVFHLYESFFEYEKTHPNLLHRCGGAGNFRFWLPGRVSSWIPDFAVVLKNAPRDIRGRRRPALAAEVVSEGAEDRDYQIKREEYLLYGLDEYWIIDPQARKVTVLIRDGDAWVERVFQGDQPIESVVLPGFATPVSALWPEAEKQA